MMKSVVPAICFFGFLSVSCAAQVSVNPGWQQRDGLTTGSSQSQNVFATKLRGFTTIESKAENPRAAVTILNAKKESGIAALLKSHEVEKTIHYTTTKIVEWEKKPSSQFSQSTKLGLWPSSNLGSYTAITRVSFDISLEGLDADEMLVLPFEICKQLAACPALESNPIVVLYVGEVDETQIVKTKQLAYDEAAAEAISLATLSGRSLGKLAELTSRGEGTRWGSLRRTYGTAYGDDVADSSLSHFAPAENEVFGTDPLNLSRTYSIELRFDIN